MIFDTLSLYVSRKKFDPNKEILQFRFHLKSRLIQSCQWERHRAKSFNLDKGKMNGIERNPYDSPTRSALERSRLRNSRQHYQPSAYYPDTSVNIATAFAEEARLRQSTTQENAPDADNSCYRSKSREYNEDDDYASPPSSCKICRSLGNCAWTTH